MAVENNGTTCTNVISFSAATVGEQVIIKNRIGAKYDIIHSDDNSITFLSNWCPPISFVSSLSISLSNIEFILTSEANDRLSSKSFYRKGLLSVQEVPFHQRESLKEFVWPHM